MKPRLFSVLALLVTVVGGVVTGSWATERKQRIAHNEFVAWVTGDDMSSLVGGLSGLGAEKPSLNLKDLPHRVLDLTLEDHQITDTTGYLAPRVSNFAAHVLAPTPDHSVIVHFGQWIDVRPAMQAVDYPAA